MNQRPVRFTLHALHKLDLVAGQGFAADMELITEFVRNPPRIYSGSDDRPVVHVPLDNSHILRVAFEPGDEIVVVTVYPARIGIYGV